MARFAVDQTGLRSQPEPKGVTIHPGVSVSLADYGADVTGQSDSTAAVRAAITAIKASSGPAGGTIIVPVHATVLHGTIPDLAQQANITFRGSGGGNGNQLGPMQPPSRLVYTGTSDTRAWDCRSSTSINFENVGVYYSSTSWTGTLIDYSHDSSNQDAARFHISDCAIGGQYNCVNAKTLVSLDGAIEGKFLRNQFMRGQTLVRGIEQTSGIGYSQPMLFQGNEWILCPGIMVANPGDQWKFDGETVEALSDLPEVGHPTAWIGTDWAGSAGGGSVTLDRCWCGDDFGFLHSWVQDNSFFGISIRIDGGLFSGGTAGCLSLAGTGSVVVQAANMSCGASDGHVIDLGTAGRTPVTIVGNNLANGNSVSGTDPILNRDSANNVGKRVILGNIGPFNSQCDDTLDFAGALAVRRHASGGGNSPDPTITPLTAAGTGATADLNHGGNFAGLIHVHTGTSPTAGYVCRLTFGKAWTGFAPFVVVTPYVSGGVLLSPVAIGTADGSNGFAYVDVYTTATPAANTDYYVQFHMIGSI